MKQVLEAPFDRFVAIDWTGAKGLRHTAVQIAWCEASGGPPMLLRPRLPWSRREVADWIGGFATRGERALIGIDCSFSLPFLDQDSYFPDADDSPSDARSLWAEVDRSSAADPDLAGHGYLERRRRWFWSGSNDGHRAKFARLRVAEAAHREQRLGSPSSPFVLVGASQVGKATLSGMRLLHQLEDFSVWPFDPVPASGPLLLEIYCQTFARDGGTRGKLRTRVALNNALETIGSPPVSDQIADSFDDHVGDALISAAGMRRAAADPAYWSPPHLTEAVRSTEGWTFGIL